MKNPLYLIIFLFFTVNAISSTSDGYVDAFWVHHAADNTFAFIVGNQKNTPTCSGGRYAVNFATEAGRMISSAIISAKFSNARVKVYGTGLCKQWFDSEDVGHISVNHNINLPAPTEPDCQKGANGLCL